MKQPFLLASSLLGSLMLISACANMGAEYRPMIDTKGVDQAQYEKDLAECQAYAQNTSGAGKTAAGGAGAGAVVGGLLGLVGGGNSTDILQAAGVGAVLGGVGGGAKGSGSQQTVIKNCLAGRGYKVLN